MRSEMEDIREDVAEQRFGSAILRINRLRDKVHSDSLYAAEQALVEWVNAFHTGKVERSDLKMRKEVMGFLTDVEV